MEKTRGPAPPGPPWGTGLYFSAHKNPGCFGPSPILARPASLPGLWSSRERSNQEELKLMRTEKKDQITAVRNKKFIPLGRPKEVILYLLMDKGKITTLLPPLNPRATRYDPSKIRVYHSNSHGHATEEC